MPTIIIMSVKLVKTHDTDVSFEFFLIPPKEKLLQKHDEFNDHSLAISRKLEKFSVKYNKLNFNPKTYWMVTFLIKNNIYFGMFSLCFPYTYVNLKLYLIVFYWFYGKLIY